MVEDYGKVAATFIDTVKGKAFLIVPNTGIRQLAANTANGWTCPGFVPALKTLTLANPRDRKMPSAI
jgi:hypothetical protein